MVRLITWNVARRVQALAAQAAAVGERACVYHHEWRDAGLSDHSALEAELRA